MSFVRKARVKILSHPENMQQTAYYNENHNLQQKQHSYHQRSIIDAEWSSDDNRLSKYNCKKSH
jgi:hypothetical protein